MPVLRTRSFTEPANNRTHLRLNQPGSDLPLCEGESMFPLKSVETAKVTLERLKATHVDNEFELRQRHVLKFPDVRTSAK